MMTQTFHLPGEDRVVDVDRVLQRYVAKAEDRFDSLPRFALELIRALAAVLLSRSCSACRRHRHRQPGHRHWSGGFDPGCDRALIARSPGAA
jgi:hypothetical protein